MRSRASRRAAPASARPPKGKSWELSRGMRTLNSSNVPVTGEFGAFMWWPHRSKDWSRHVLATARLQSSKTKELRSKYIEIQKNTTAQEFQIPIPYLVFLTCSDVISLAHHCVPVGCGFACGRCGLTGEIETELETQLENIICLGLVPLWYHFGTTICQLQKLQEQSTVQRVDLWKITSILGVSNLKWLKCANPSGPSVVRHVRWITCLWNLGIWIFPHPREDHSIRRRRSASPRRPDPLENRVCLSLFSWPHYATLHHCTSLHHAMPDLSNIT